MPKTEGGSAYGVSRSFHHASVLALSVGAFLFGAPLAQAIVVSLTDAASTQWSSGSDGNQNTVLASSDVVFNNTLASPITLSLAVHSSRDTTISGALINGAGLIISGTRALALSAGNKNDRQYASTQIGPVIDVNSTGVQRRFNRRTIGDATNMFQSEAAQRYTVNGVYGLALLTNIDAGISLPTAIYTWTGGGGNVNWSTAGNWSGGSPVSDDFTDLIFSGTTNTGTAGTPLNQDIASPIYINSITFSSGGGAFFLGGNNLRMQGASDTITQNSSSAENIANDFSAPNINSLFTITLTGDGTGVVTLGGAILSGTAAKDYAIAKSGTSTFVLSGASTYGGGTTVNSGCLYINNIGGSGTGTGNVSVTGGTFGGSGTVSGAVSVASGANLSPGALGAGTTAVFHTGNLTLSSGANFVLDLINTTVGTGYDQVNVTGTVNITGSNLVLNSVGGLSIGDTFYILANNGVDPIIGTFSQGATITSGNNVFAIDYMANFGGAGSGNDISLTLVIPEASTWISGLIAVAIAIVHGIMVRVHRRRHLQKNESAATRNARGYGSTIGPN